jgi:trans-aconitate 2-methyltransferase
VAGPPSTQPLRIRGDERVLDVGCGDGRVTESVRERLEHGSHVGVDPSVSMVEAARQRLAGSGRAVAELGEAATLRYHAEFDLVVSFNALHWELRWRQALHRIRDALRTGGRALLVHDDLRWDFGSRAAFAAWCSAGMVPWTSRLANDQRQAFVDDVLSAYAEVSGSDSVFAFLQFTTALTAANDDH